MSYDYHDIDLSPATDAQKDEEFAFLLQFGSPQSKNRMSFKRAGLAKGVRDNNLSMVQEYLSAMEDPEFGWDIVQAAARGHDEIFCFLAQQDIRPHVATCALEAAAYYGRTVCVECILPYCLGSVDDWKIGKGIDAALEGGQLCALALLLPHANVQKHNSCILRSVLERGNYDAAEILFEYINPQDAITNIKEYAAPDEIPSMLEWIEHQLSARLKANLGQAIAPIVTKRPSKSAVKKI